VPDAGNYRVVINNSNVLAAGTWLHLVLTYNGNSGIAFDHGNVKIYCDDAPVLPNLVQGGVYFDSDDGVFKIWDDTAAAWVSIIFVPPA
jgi:hypothetical protein